LCLGLLLESILLSVASRFINVVSHGFIVLHRAGVFLGDAGDIGVWRVWILDKAISRWVNDLKVERVVAALAKRRQLLNELVNLLRDLWVKLAALLLQISDAFDCGEKVAFHGLN